MRTCTKCNIEKEEDDFTFKNKKLGKRSSTCRICHKGYVDNHYKNNKQYYIDKAKKNKKTYENKYSKYKETLSCTDCNLSFKGVPFLCDFHHINDDKEISPSLLSQSWKKFVIEIKKCVPLCANCHRKRHYGVIV